MLESVEHRVPALGNNGPIKEFESESNPISYKETAIA